MDTEKEKDIFSSSQRLGSLLKDRGLVVGTAESCTGGWLGQAITMVPGSSAWYHSGIITYSNLSKIKQLGVDPDLIDQYGAVSEMVVKSMATGVMANVRSDCAIATTGIAGPGGGTSNKPVGTVWIGACDKTFGIKTKRYLFLGDRNAVRRQTVVKGLQLLECLLLSK